MIVDTSKTSTRELYSLLIECIIPRPIAWVSTRSKDGVDNLAPFSFFNIFGIDPPTLGFSPGFRQVNGQLVPKDTLRNVMDTQEFVVHIVSEELAEQMNRSSGEYAQDVSEFKVTGLESVPADEVNALRVSSAGVACECKLTQIVELGPLTRLVLGRILRMHVNDSVLTDGHVDVLKLLPISRLGLDQYAKTRDVFSMSRPRV